MPTNRQKQESKVKLEGERGDVISGSQLTHFLLLIFLNQMNLVIRIILYYAIKFLFISSSNHLLLHLFRDDYKKKADEIKESQKKIYTGMIFSTFFYSI